MTEHSTELQAYQPPKPFAASLEGWSSGDIEDWPNTVTVEVVESWHDQEQDPTCGDCVAGRCHWGGKESEKSAAAAFAGQDYVSPSGPCGCDRHDASVRARDYEDDRYADSYGTRHLVEIDTNYKPTRQSEHPVRLTRVDAVRLAGHLLAAAEDTFHYARCGQLRAAEAAEILRSLGEVELALSEIRDHAVGDLLDAADLHPDGAA